jgi:hypothetical protein
MALPSSNDDSGVRASIDRLDSLPFRVMVPPGKTGKAIPPRNAAVSHG